MLNRLLLSLMFSLLVVSCEPAGVQPEPVRIRLAGPEGVHPLFEQLTSAYTTQYPYVDFEFEAIASRTSLRLLRAGQCDVVVSSWPPSEAELNSDREPQQLLKANVFASDGLVLVVHPQNPVGGLSIIQLRGIFSGHVPDWREVGGKVGDVLVISREGGSDDRETFETLVMDKQPVTLGAIVMPGSSDVVQYVASHPNAIGYAPIAEVIPEVKPIAIDGVHPTYETILDGSYPLWRHLAVITADPAERPVQDFLGFLVGTPGQSVINDYYAFLRS